MAAALEGVDTVVDLANVKTVSKAKAVAHFTGTTRRLGTLEKAAGVRHHVVLGIVNSDRVPFPYDAGKLAQERVAADAAPRSRSGCAARTVVRGSSVRTMRAALYRHTGPASEVLSVEEVATPEPAAGEVRVRLAVSGVNPTDWKSRSGAVPMPGGGADGPGFQIPHHDGAGVIDAVGAGVDPGRVGQRVWTYLAAHGRPWGTAAECTVVPADRAVPLPDNAPFELGANLGVPAVTAHRCLFADGPVDGRTVLVAGGAGAVGHFAIELAVASGATVIATVSGPEKAKLAAAAGAHHVVNYREAGAAERIKQVAADGVDRIVEVDLADNLALDLAVAGRYATIVTYAATAKQPTLSVRELMTRNLVLRFMLLYTVPPEALTAAAQDLTSALAAGALTPLPSTTFPLERTADAHDAVEAGAVGKVLVTIGGPDLG